MTRAWALAVLLAAFAAAPAQAFFGGVPDWPELKQSLREKHPSVPQLTTAALRAWLADGTRARPLLLDARDPAEFEVSQLRGARLAPDLASALRALEGRSRDAPVVVYCSVGVRSSALAEQLQREGWRNVQNLEGSLFEWANRGYPLYRGGAPAATVHPYDERWGRLLERRLWPERSP